MIICKPGISDNVIGKKVRNVLAFSFGWEEEYLKGGGRGMEAMLLGSFCYC